MTPEQSITPFQKEQLHKYYTAGTRVIHKYGFGCGRADKFSLCNFDNKVFRKPVLKIKTAGTNFSRKIDALSYDAQKHFFKLKSEFETTLNTAHKHKTKKSQTLHFEKAL